MGSYFLRAAAVEAMAETMEECSAVSKNGPGPEHLSPLSTGYGIDPLKSDSWFEAV